MRKLVILLIALVGAAVVAKKLGLLGDDEATWHTTEVPPAADSEPAPAAGAHRADVPVDVSPQETPGEEPDEAAADSPAEVTAEATAEATADATTAATTAVEAEPRP